MGRTSKVQWRVVNTLPYHGDAFETREEAEAWLEQNGYERLDHIGWATGDGDNYAYPYACPTDLDRESLDGMTADEILDEYGHGYEPLLVEEHI